MKKLLMLLLSLTLLSGCRYDFKYSSNIYGEKYKNIDNMTSYRFSKEYFNMPFYPSKTMWGDTNIRYGRLIGSASSLEDANKKIRKHFNNESYGTKNEVAETKLIFENEYVYGIYTEWNYFGYNVAQNLNENVYVLKEDKCEVIQNVKNEDYYIKVNTKEEMCSVITYIYYPIIRLSGVKLLSVPIENVKEDKLNWQFDVYYCLLTGGDYDENNQIYDTIYLRKIRVTVNKENRLLEEFETKEITKFKMETMEFTSKFIESLEKL